MNKALISLDFQDARTENDIFARKRGKEQLFLYKYYKETRSPTTMNYIEMFKHVGDVYNDSINDINDLSDHHQCVKSM